MEGWRRGSRCERITLDRGACTPGVARLLSASTPAWYLRARRREADVSAVAAPAGSLRHAVKTLSRGGASTRRCRARRTTRRRSRCAVRRSRRRSRGRARPAPRRPASRATRRTSARTSCAAPGGLPPARSRPSSRPTECSPSPSTGQGAVPARHVVAQASHNAPLPQESRDSGAVDLRARRRTRERGSPRSEVPQIIAARGSTCTRC